MNMSTVDVEGFPRIGFPVRPRRERGRERDREGETERERERERERGQGRQTRLEKRPSYLTDPKPKGSGAEAGGWVIRSSVDVLQGFLNWLFRDAY